jgi:hypothetical protein
MNKLKAAIGLILGSVVVSILFGCGHDDTPVIPSAAAAHPITYNDDDTYTKFLPEEICYKGVTYVIFGASNQAVGSVELDRDGRVVTCAK